VDQGVAEGLLGSDPNRGQKVPGWAKGGIIGKIGRKLDPAWSDIQMTVPQHLLSKQSSVPDKKSLATKDMPKAKATSITPTRAIPKRAGINPSHPVTKNVVKTIADKSGVAEADKHSFIGRIQRHNELKNKVDRTWKDAIDAEKQGDKSGATRAFNKHVRYTNLERPGTWRTVKDNDVTESDTLMLKLHQALLQEGRVKELADDLKTMNDAEFMKKYGKAKAAIRRDMKKVDEGNANSGRRGPNSPPDNTPVKLGRVQKVKTGIKHHADSSRYGGTVPDTDDDHLLSPAARHRLHKAVTPDQQDLDEGNMPQSVIKSKQKYADMSDQEFHAAHKNKSEDDLKSMAWRHGYGKGSNHYVTRHKKGGGQLNELSTNKLAQYKTAAAADAKKADQAGDVKRGDKRFGGIVKATKKQFDNDAKKIDESRRARQALMARIANSR
jgi:hypothetical protein